MSIRFVKRRRPKREFSSLRPLITCHLDPLLSTSPAIAAAAARIATAMPDAVRAGFGKTRRPQQTCRGRDRQTAGARHYNFCSHVALTHEIAIAESSCGLVSMPGSTKIDFALRSIAAVRSGSLLLAGGFLDHAPRRIE